MVMKNSKGFDNRRRILCMITIFMVMLIMFVSCVGITNNPEKTNFERDSFINLKSLRNKIDKNAYIDDSIDYMFYGLSSGEVVLTYNYDLPFTMRVLSLEYDSDVYPPPLGAKNRPPQNGLIKSYEEDLIAETEDTGIITEKTNTDASVEEDGIADVFETEQNDSAASHQEKGDGLINPNEKFSDITLAGDGLFQKWGYIRRHYNIEINMNRTFNDFNDYETELWLAALLSSMSYIIINRANEDDMQGVNPETVGKIFLESLDPYVYYQSKRIPSILAHPVIVEYTRLKKEGTPQEKDLFYADIFDVTANTLYLAYPRERKEVEKLKDLEKSVVDAVIESTQGLSDAQPLTREEDNSDNATTQ